MSQPHLTSTTGSTPRRFNAHLDGLKGEFNLMAQQIDTMRKERDEYRAKGTYSVLIPWKYCFTKLLL
jgi:hypothetical protein